jgi:hypothetical protein
MLVYNFGIGNYILEIDNSRIAILELAILELFQKFYSRMIRIGVVDEQGILMY